MTLLLIVASRAGVHQSSDYRLTDIATRRPIEDAFGSKQLQFSFDSWSAQISFTGIAEFGGLKTGDWISGAMNGTPQSAEVSAAMQNLATVATQILGRLAPVLRQLTIVVTISQAVGGIRLFVISCIDRPVGPPLPTPLDHLEVYELPCDDPRVFIFGCKDAVQPADQKLLKDLSSGGRDPAHVRAILAEINLRSAKRSRGLVSQGCFVSSVLPGGIGASENSGRVPGIPTHMGVPDEIRNLLHQNFPGKQPVFVQGREVHGKETTQITTQPMTVAEGNSLVAMIKGDTPILFLTDSGGNTYTVLPNRSGIAVDDDEIEASAQLGQKTGEPKKMSFSSPTATNTIHVPGGPPIGEITIGGVNGTVVLTKNAIARAVLNTITIRMYPPAWALQKPLTLLGQIPTNQTIDGGELHSWIYSIDAVFDGGWEFSIRRNSVAVRSANYKTSLGVTTNLEEIAMAAPRNFHALRVSAQDPVVKANIEARFLLRDLT